MRGLQGAYDRTKCSVFDYWLATGFVDVILVETSQFSYLYVQGHDQESCKQCVMTEIYYKLLHTEFALFLLITVYMLIIQFTILPRTSTPTDTTYLPCAINFYGLPRSFRRYVLPSVIENVIQMNPSCDYFVHYYVQESEPAGRSGFAANISNPYEIQQDLAQAIQKYAHSNVTLRFVHDTEQDFQRVHGVLVHQWTHQTEPNSSKLTYLPWDDRTYTLRSLENIAKMWYSQHRVFETMQQMSYPKKYDTVAMLRNDVVFVTPIRLSYAAREAILPRFACYPVNDRMFMGPYAAVEIWATQRFSSIDKFVDRMKRQGRLGSVLHSETFVEQELLPRISASGTPIRTDASICFLRSRSDGYIWASDCDRMGKCLRFSFGSKVQQIVRYLTKLYTAMCRVEDSGVDFASLWSPWKLLLCMLLCIGSRVPRRVESKALTHLEMDPTLLLWEEEVPPQQKSGIDGATKNHIQRKCWFWMGPNPEASSTDIIPDPHGLPSDVTFHLQPPYSHPLRAQRWKLLLQSRGKLPFSSEVIAEFDLSGYVRLTWASDDQGTRGAIGKWDLCTVTRRLGWEIMLGGQHYQFYADWIPNSFAVNPKLARGVTLHDKRRLFKPIVATFRGTGLPTEE